MHIETVLEKFSCSICRCEFLIYPNDFNLEAKFADVSCASCGREVTESELFELWQSGEFKQPKKLDTSMLK
ncbi:ECs_2282 family putative zinc-binding protein [Rahnella aceris]